MVGDAAVTSVRGKKKYIYDFSVDLVWDAVITGVNGACSGTVAISEITAECTYEVVHKDMSMPKTSNPSSKRLLDNLVKSTSTGLMPAVNKALNKFLDDFKLTQ